MKSSIISILLLILFGIPKLYGQATARPDAHAPIGVMADHVHSRNEIMFSYRFMVMHMEDNLIDGNEISADQIVTSIPNRFSDMPGQPPTLRVVPRQMNMYMHMFGAMYAPSDKITLMGMLPIVIKSMQHTTYQGGMGTDILGTFTSRSTGIGDSKIIGLYRVNSHLHFNLGLSIPTGSIEKEGAVLTPMNMHPTIRQPYPMQPGSGTLDILPGLTYAIHKNNLGFGGQISSILRTGSNKNEFRYGHLLESTLWGSYRLAAWLSTSLRILYCHSGKISGIDPDIVAPVQTANPDFSGGDRLDGLIGLNAIGQKGFVRNQRLAAEFGIPLTQVLNGPQLQVRSVVTVGWQYAF